MAYDDFEKSAHLSTPVELYTFIAPSMTTRVTSWHKDVSFGGDTYLAEPLSRSNLQIVDAHTDQFDATIELRAAHALVQHYANGVPPREISCLVQRYQPSSGLAIQVWFGYVGALSFKGRMGSFRIPSATADQLELNSPSVICSRLCNHVLYDTRCSIPRTSFDIGANITSISADGRTFGIDVAILAAVTGTTIRGVVAPTVQWATHGELLHVPTGERRTVTTQNSSSSITVQIEFGGGVTGVQIGDPVVLYAGCDHTRAQCHAKFANVINFGGHPDIPRSNPFLVNLFNIEGNG